MSRARSFALLLVSLCSASAAIANTQTATGTVYLDRNNNQLRDAGEPGVPGVLVSNGVEVVATNANGEYELPVSDETVLFVIKPRNYRTLTDHLNLWRGYYIHKPNGSPDADFIFKGTQPTGPLPPAVDFPLYASPEPARFTFLALGDTQIYSMQQIDWLAQDTFAEIIDNNAWGAAFAVTLGDLVGDNLALHHPLNQLQAKPGIPWFNVVGNHDMNYMATSDRHSKETFTDHYGPATYAFQHGSAHFIILDTIIWNGFAGMNANNTPRGNNYRGGLRDSQLKFIENYLAHTPKDELVVLMMHIPLDGEGVHVVPERRRLFEILSSHPHTLSLSGHTHFNEHWFFGSKDGYTAGKEHHHWNAGAVCGSWFNGAQDPRGIPHTTMRCGAPNGYSLVTIDGNDYAIRYKVSSRPADYQMDIAAPTNIAAAEAAGSELIVNVFAGSAKSRVEYQLNDGPWLVMQRDERPAPVYAETVEREKNLPRLQHQRGLPSPRPSTHVWVAKLPANLPSGACTIRVRHTDMFNQTDHATRVIYLN